MALTGTQIALRDQVSEDLSDGDILMTQMPFLGMLLGFDAFFKTPGARFDVGGPLKGEALQEDFRVGLPTSRGVDATTPNFNQLIAPLQKGMNIVSGTLTPSAFDVHEVLPKYYMNRIEDSVESITDYVMETSEAVLDSLRRLWNRMLFPPTNLQPTIAAGYNGAPAIDRLMAVAYPLQTGYVLNAATGTGTYNYLGIDMNLTAYSGMKARNSGTTTAAFGTPSVDNLLVEQVQTKHNGGDPDMFVCDTETFAFIGDLANDAVRLQQSEKLTYGGRMFNINGMNLLVDQRMDRLSDSFSDEDNTIAATEYREAYMLTSKRLRWRNTDITDLQIMDYPGGASFELMQGYYEAIHWNRNPRHHCRLFNITGV